MHPAYTIDVPDKVKQSDFLIKEVLTDADLDEFISFPVTLYDKNPYFVPPLKNDEKALLKIWDNPAFRHCEARYWLAYKNGTVVGRIAGIINPEYIQEWGCRYARFGWFDAIHDQQVADGLLRQVESWAREKEMDAIHGPMGFCNFNPAGMLVEGFNEIPTLAELYNYPYYQDLLKCAGYQKEVDWVSYQIAVPKQVPLKVAQFSRIVKKRHQLTVLKPKHSKEIKKYASEIFNLINICYQHLHGMVPLSNDQIQYYTNHYLSYIRKDFISLVTNHHGNLIALGITIPSLSKAFQKARGKLLPFGIFHVLHDLYRNDMVELCLVAIHPDYQGKGVNAILMEEMNHTFLRNKIKLAESNPELESNARVQSMWTYYETRQHKRRRCYIKHLT
ncbi:MAG: GNAT family N-acetyltransferase [Cyclobacteriaceae bacterium]